MSQDKQTQTTNSVEQFRAKLIEKFEALQTDAETVRDRVYLDGVIAVIVSEPVP